MCEGNRHIFKFIVLVRAQEALYLSPSSLRKTRELFYLLEDTKAELV